MIQNFNDHPYIVVNMSNQIQGKYEGYGTNYIVQGKTADNKGTVFNYHERKDLAELFSFMWTGMAINVVVLYYGDVNKNQDIIVYTSNPITSENKCGDEVNIIQSQRCNSANLIITFPKIIKNYNQCTIVYGTNGAAKINNTKSYMNTVRSTLDEVKKMMNATIAVKYINENEHNRAKFQYRHYFSNFVFNYPSNDDKTDIFFYDDMLWFGTKAEKKLNTFFIPFSLNTWILILVVFIIAIVILWQGQVLQNFTSFKFQTFFLSFSQITSLSFAVSTPLILKLTGLKILILFYLIYIIHIQTAYTSDSINNLVVPYYDDPIRNVRELADSDVPIFISKIHRQLFFDKDVTNFNTFNKINRKLIQVESYDEIINNSYRKYFVLVRQSMYAFRFTTEIHKVQNRFISNEITGSLKVSFFMLNGHYMLPSINRAKTIPALQHLILTFFQKNEWNDYNTPKGRFLIITQGKDIEEGFLFMWKFLIINIVVLHYENNHNNQSVKVYTANPLSVENKCGREVNKIQEQICSDNITIVFPEVIKNYNKCNFVLGIGERQPLQFRNQFTNSIRATLNGIERMLNGTIKVEIQNDMDLGTALFYNFMIFSLFGRTDLVESTHVFYYDDMIWFGSRAERRLNKFFVPFHTTTWILVIIVYVLVVLVWWLGLMVQKGDRCKLQALFGSFSQISSLMFAVSIPAIPNSTSLKMLILFYFCYLIHIQTAYTSDTIHNLVTPSYKGIIKNVHDLAESDYPIVIEKVEHMHHFGTDEVPNFDVFNKINNKLVIYDDVEETIHYNFKKRFMVTPKWSNDIIGSFKLSFYTLAGHFAVSSINRVIRYLHEYGFYRKAYNDGSELVPTVENNYAVLTGLDISELEDWAYPLRINDLTSVLAKTIHTLQHLIITFFQSKEWNDYNTPKRRFLIITQGKDIEEGFLFMWKFLIINIVVLQYENNHNNQSVKVYTANPLTIENKCGGEVNELVPIDENNYAILTGLDISEMEDWAYALRIDDLTSVLIVFAAVVLVWWLGLMYKNVIVSIPAIPNSTSLKILILFYFCYLIHIQTAYTSDTIHNLVTPSYKGNIKNVYDLADSNYPIVIDKVEHIYLFSADEVPNFDVYNKINNKLVVFDAVDELINFNFTKRFTVSPKWSNDITGSFKLSLYMLPGHFAVFSINRVIRFLHEYGFYRKAYNDESELLTTYENNYAILTGLDISEIEDWAYPLRIDDLTSVFIVVAAEIIKNYNQCTFVLGVGEGQPLQLINPFTNTLRATLSGIERMLNATNIVITEEDFDRGTKRYRNYMTSSIFGKSEVVESTNIFFYDDMIWYGTKAEKRLNKFFEPFHTTTWILVFIVYVLVILTWWLSLMLQKFDKCKLQALFDSFSQTSSLLFVVPIPTIPNSTPLKILIPFYFCYLIHIQTAYTSDTINNLVSPSYKDIIKNIQDLADSNYPIVIEKNELSYHFGREVPNFDVYNKIKKKLVVFEHPDEIEKYNFTKLFMVTPKCRYSYTYKVTVKKVTNEFISNDITGSFKLSFYMLTGHYAVSSINKVIRFLDEYGFYRKAYNDGNELLVTDEKNCTILSSLDVSEVEDWAYPLRIHDFISVLIVVAVVIFKDLYIIDDPDTLRYKGTDLYVYIIPFEGVNYKEHQIVLSKNDSYIAKLNVNFFQSSLWNEHNTRKRRFLIITQEKDIAEVFLFLWRGLLINAVIYTSNPLTIENKCGDEVKKIQEQICSNNIGIAFREIIKNYNQCTFVLGAGKGQPLELMNPFTNTLRETLSGIHRMLNATIKVIIESDFDRGKNLYKNYMVFNIYGRSNAIESTNIFYYDDMVWFGSKAERRLNNFFEPFYTTTWILFFIVYVLVVLIWWLGLMLQKFDKCKLQTLFDSFSQISSLLFAVSIPTIPNSTPLKILILFYFYYLIHIQTAYTSDTINNLVSPSYKDIIKNVQDLAVSKYPIVIEKTEHLYHFGREVPSFNIYNKINKKLIVFEHPDEIAKYNFTKLFMVTPKCRYSCTYKVTVKKVTNTFISNDITGSFKLSFYMSSGHYAVSSINIVVRFLHEYGFYRKAYHDENELLRGDEGNYAILDKLDISEVEDWAYPLRIHDLLVF
ncbi:hypothetical protein FQR65_LT07148 [Abscondita terminalis]|nr:hypothetical protein FQR65_LT07148 [Abscondita terminalis]